MTIKCPLYRVSLHLEKVKRRPQPRALRQGVNEDRMLQQRFNRPHERPTNCVSFRDCMKMHAFNVIRTAPFPVAPSGVPSSRSVLTKADSLGGEHSRKQIFTAAGTFTAGHSTEGSSLARPFCSSLLLSPRDRDPVGSRATFFGDRPKSCSPKLYSCFVSPASHFICSNSFADRLSPATSDSAISCRRMPIAFRQAKHKEHLQCLQMATEASRGTTSRMRASASRATASMLAARALQPNTNIIHDPSLDGSDSGKRNRYQYSCLQCQRRKQRCSRTIPARSAVQRGIAHLCSPPSNLHRPSRRIRMRQKLALAASGQEQSVDKKEDQDHPDDMDDTDTYELDDEQNASSSQLHHDLIGGSDSCSRVNHSVTLGPADASLSSFAAQSKAYDQGSTASHPDQDLRNRHYAYMQHPQQQQTVLSPHRYQEPVSSQSRRFRPYYGTSAACSDSETPQVSLAAQSQGAQICLLHPDASTAFQPIRLHSASALESDRMRQQGASQTATGTRATREQPTRIRLRPAPALMRSPNSQRWPSGPLCSSNISRLIHRPISSPSQPQA